MRLKALILLIAVSLLAGCASYERMYGQYAAGMTASCGSGPQPLIEFTDSGGTPVTVYQRDEGCRMAPPDNPARIAADTAKSVVSDTVKGVIGFKAVDELGSTLRRGYDRAGDQVGGDGFIGDTNQGFTDETSEPFVVEPAIVEVPAEE